jgi:RNA polymerase sigma-70 factor (ECF subfamily)
VDRYIELDDSQLAHLAREDHDAFDVLYRRHVTPVYRYCYARTNNVADAEDLTAQTFLAALESIGRFRGKSHFPAWLFGIARNKCADYYRKTYAQPSEPIDEDADPVDPTSEDPEEHAFLATILDCIDKMLGQLSPDRLEALRLRYWGGLTMQEVAKVMQRSEAAIKMLVSRAVADLRERCVTQ